ncbi:MAG: hypothetical protein LBC18_04205 [Opitutaceae bacterium]|nr:hypothetical protein [Opitutaceae bacterium]
MSRRHRLRQRRGHMAEGDILSLAGFLFCVAEQAVPFFQDAFHAEAPAHRPSLRFQQGANGLAKRLVRRAGVFGVVSIQAQQNLGQPPVAIFRHVIYQETALPAPDFRGFPVATTIVEQIPDEPPEMVYKNNRHFAVHALGQFAVGKYALEKIEIIGHFPQENEIAPVIIFFPFRQNIREIRGKTVNAPGLFPILPHLAKEHAADPAGFAAQFHPKGRVSLMFFAQLRHVFPSVEPQGAVRLFLVPIKTSDNGYGHEKAGDDCRDDVGFVWDFPKVERREHIFRHAYCRDHEQDCREAKRHNKNPFHFAGSFLKNKSPGNPGCV